MSERKVLVTGGAGYVGSHACKALARAGYSPVTYDNLSTGNRWAVKWGPLELGDVQDAARLREVVAAHRPIAAMHFAALALVGESVRDPALYYQSNVGGSLAVLDACRTHGVGSVVFSSTCAVYGSPDAVPIPEKAATAPVSPYGMSKLMIEHILADYSKAYGLRHVALRYFNAAGADPDTEIGERREVETHLIPLMLDAAAGRRPGVKVLGDDYPTADGTAVRDYIHVSDLADAHVRALDYLLAGRESHTLNLGTGWGYSVLEVIAEAERVTGRSIPHEVAARRSGDPPVLVADASLSQTLLGGEMTRRSSLSEILQTAWAWQSSDAYVRSFAAEAVSS